ncbi:MAG TPA: DNA primase [Geothermobacteraceae bacterium]|nr:DNA primase [Geothermobacteraceae bacterium]
MGRIDEDKILQIRERVDIVEVVSRYLPLKRSGANNQGLCPFHGEKTPSFNVNSTRQIFHCFGCGVGGNVFNFLMRMEGLSFPEAVRRLGEQVGIEIEEEQLSPEEEERRRELDRLRRINEVAAEFYQSVLLNEPEGEAARNYLKRRGFDRELASQFLLGYAPDRWEALAVHLADKGLDPELARKLGLIRPGKQERGDYDLFRGRLMFPILDSYGKVVAFGGRVLDDSLPKYINSSESPIYHKSRTLYGLSQAKEGMRGSGEVVVVEGYFDLLALWRAGVHNVVATCGTALTGEHARLLKRYAKRVLLLFDQDAAGRQATFKAMEGLLPEGLAVATVTLDAGEDPDSYLVKQGVEALRRKLELARPVLEVFIEETLAAAGSDVEQRARAIDEVIGRIKLLGSDVEQRLYLAELAKKAGLSENFLLGKLTGGRRNQRPATSRPTEPPRSAAPVQARVPTAGLRAQDLLLQLMLCDPAVRQQVAGEGPASLFQDADRRSLAEAICRLDAEQAVETLLDGDALSSEQAAVLSGILMKDRGVVADESEQILNDCRRSLVNEDLKTRRDELNESMAAAEKAGDTERHASLYREWIEIQNKMRLRKK